MSLEMDKTRPPDGPGEIAIPDPVLTLRPRALSGDLLPEYVIDRYPSTIGRHPTNDIELPFEAISRYHARVELHSGQPRLVDLRSSNGTFVNGDRVETAVLRDQDSLSFGGLDFALTIQARADSGHPDANPTSDSDATAVHFVSDGTQGQAVFHAEIPDDTGGIRALSGDLMDADQLRKAQQQLITLYRLQEALHTTSDEQVLFRRVLELLFSALPVDRGVILMRDATDGSVFHPVAIKTRPGLTRSRIGISRTILQNCLRDKVAVLTRDAPTDARFDASDSVAEHQMRSVLCAPLISVRQIFGFCHLDTVNAVRSFTEEDLTFLANVASELATHLHNLRMMQEKIATERMAAIGQTITGMAHNIKNILVLTQGGIEMMEKRLKSKHYDALEETWDVVRRGLGRINGLTQDMLDYSRARTVQRSRVDINAMLRDQQQTFADQFRRQHIDCRLALDEALRPIMIDGDGLEKALVNLIVNASEAVPDRGGRISLRTRLGEDESVLIEIEDNGSGIPKEVLPRVFVPFFTTKGSKGSGLGLSMTRKFIEDMGGRIEVSSEEGKGTCFRITLRVAPDGSPRLGGASPDGPTMH